MQRSFGSILSLNKSMVQELLPATEGLFKCQAVKKVNDVTSVCFHSYMYHITLQIKLALLRDFFPPITITTCHTGKAKLCFGFICKGFKCKIKS